MLKNLSLALLSLAKKNLSKIKQAGAELGKAQLKLELELCR